MFRVPKFALASTASTALLALCAGLAGCADDTTAHRGHPPQDPADYHGVPTDTRPPVMVPAAP